MLIKVWYLLIGLLLTLSGDILIRCTWHLYASKQDWVSSIISTSGNIAGGVIGGFVALLVARYQIMSDKVSEKQREENEFRTSLLMFIDDLKHTTKTLDSLIKSQSIDEELVTLHVRLPSWEVIRPLCIKFLSEELYMKCNRLNKQFELVHLLVKTHDVTLNEFKSLRQKCDSLTDEIDQVTSKTRN